MGGLKYSTFPEHLCDDNSAPVVCVAAAQVFVGKERVEFPSLDEIPFSEVAVGGQRSEVEIN